MEEMTIVDRVVVDVEDFSRLDDHAAISPAEPLLALYRHTITNAHRQLTVHGFTAGGQALVLDPTAGRLVHTWEAAGNGERFVGVTPQADPPEISAIGPYTPAPLGLTAVFADATQVPVVFYDLLGRPVVVDTVEKTRCLVLLDEDQVERIEYQPPAAREVGQGR
jgi:hypothetical protein